jgi:hypothetical protein
MLVRRTFPILIALLLLAAEPRVPQLHFLHDHVHAQEQLPPVSYICPMDAEVVDDKPGRCPICRMDLEPVRLDLAWSCPNHAAVITTKPGLCPIDKRELVQVTVSKYWSCADAGNTRFLEPGQCGNGQPRKLEQALRAHGDHNPRYGGQFFMAADKWHHLEGTHPEQGRFRVFMYDNFTRPIDAKGMSGRVAVLDDANAEVSSSPLTLSKDGKTLEAAVKQTALPLKAAAFVKFDDKTPEQRFDFAFQEYSKEPAVKPAVTTPSAAPTPAPGAGARAGSCSPDGGCGHRRLHVDVAHRRLADCPGAAGEPARTARTARALHAAGREADWDGRLRFPVHPDDGQQGHRAGFGRSRGRSSRGTACRSNERRAATRALGLAG